MQHDVLRFEVAVDNAVAVEFINGGADLLHEGSSLDLRQRLATLELLEELPTHSNFKDDIDMLVVFEEPVHFDYVGVVQKHLDLHLPDKLLHDLLLQ
jgi:hypothetical protein